MLAHSNIREIATSYVRRDWAVVPMPYRSKKPVIDEWQNLRITGSGIGRYFGNRQMNIGVLLGEPSRWLVDVDLDHMLAVELAARFLPSTGAIFGRKSKRRSHWLYYASRPVGTRQFRLDGKRMIVELRSTGGQTVFPPSIHEKGEAIEWDCEGEPATVDPDELLGNLSQIYEEVCQRLNVPVASQIRRPAAEKSAPTHVMDRARKYIAKMPVAISGQGGHRTTYHTTCILALGFGLDRRDTLTILREWNEGCQPPWSERDLEHKVDDVLKEPGWRGYLLTGQPRPTRPPATTAIERANRHAIEHRRRARRRSHA